MIALNRIIVVRLVRGSEVISTTVTAADGSYSLDVPTALLADAGSLTVDLLSATDQTLPTLLRRHEAAFNVP